MFFVLFRCLAFGLPSPTPNHSLPYQPASFCTECYYKPGTCKEVHQGTLLPHLVPPPLTMPVGGEVTTPAQVPPLLATPTTSVH